MTKTEIINGTTINYQGNEYGVIPEVYFEDPYKIGEIKENSTAIDIGACIGVFSLRCAKERGCTVYAYEPYLESYKLATENAKINGLEDKIKIFNKAVIGGIISGTNITKYFYIHLENFAGCTFYPGKGILYEKVSVGCTTLTDIFKDNNLDKCDIVKIDCEGEEKNIIKDTDIDILKKIDKIIIEYHLYVDGKEIMEYLRSVGFDVHFNPGKELPPVERSILYATRTK